MTVGFNFAPRGWALCDGQILAINQNSALFSLLGTTYGGDGRATFGLPDLRGRSAVHVGAGPGLAGVTWGQKGGQEQVTLTTQNLPPHSHQLFAENTAATTGNPTNNKLARTPESLSYAPDDVNKSDKLMGPSIGNTGNGQAFNNRNPYLGVYTVIATVGIFPSRS